VPEGDTIHRLAARLRPALIGHPIREAASRWPSAAHGLAGASTVRIEPVGKHLWIELDDGQALRIHLGMRGKGRIHDPAVGSPLRTMAEVSLRLVLDVAVVEFTGAPTVERGRVRERPVHPVLTALGPDLLGEAFDVDAVLARIDRWPAATVAEVLLEQRVACGIGNVYKSEVLFVRRRHPFDPPAALSADDWRGLYGTARDLMQRNLGPGRRITTGPAVPSDTWVYGRGGRPCLRCRTRIVSRLHGGDLPRHTWWCPRCQPPVSGRSG
jgi:endonuclease VIII